jgi:hypothetical protein
VFFFGTITGLDTQVDVFISLMKPAFSKMCSSAAIAFFWVHQTVGEVA